MSRARIYHFLFSKHLLFQYILVNNLIFSAQLNFDFKKIRTATTIKRESDKFDYIFKKNRTLSIHTVGLHCGSAANTLSRSFCSLFSVAKKLQGQPGFFL